MRDDDERRRRRPGRPLKQSDGVDSALGVLGVQLRTLRTRQELTLSELAGRTGYSPQHLGAVERAGVMPSEAVITACDAALLANGALITLLGPAIREQAQARSRNEQVRRAKHGQAADAATSPQVDWERLADAGRRVSVVTSSVVDDLEQITERQRRLYHQLTSAEMVAQVQAHLDLLTTLLKSKQRGQLHSRIASAAAEAAGFAAWLWFDLGDMSATRRHYAYARYAADEAGNLGLDAYVRGYQGLVAGQTGNLTEALEHLDSADSSAPRSLSGTTRAWLRILLAEAFAHTGQPKPAINAISDAHELLAEGRAIGVDPWMYDFDQGSLSAHAGTCYVKLNQPKHAVRAFTEALQLLPPSCDRRGARIRVGLARAHLAAGEVDEALCLATVALDTFAARGSAAGLGAVRALRESFAQIGSVQAAHALDERVRYLRNLGR
jgi:tetratricopeptide (TPR) repeat protein